MIVTWQTSGGDASGLFGSGKTNVLEYAVGTGPKGSYTNDFATTGITNIITMLGVVVTNATHIGAATNGPSLFYRVRLVL
jgi:hypothetical protein